MKAWLLLLVPACLSGVEIGNKMRAPNVRVLLIFCELCLLLLIGCLAESAPLSQLTIDRIAESANVSDSSSFTWSATGHFVAQTANQSNGSQVIEVIDSANASVKLRLSNKSLKVIGWTPADTSLIAATDYSLTEIGLSGRIRTLVTSTLPIMAAKPSPDAKLIAFARDNKLFVLKPKSGEIRLIAKATNCKGDCLVGIPDPILARDFHQATAFWWSPDSSSIAWLETRQTSTPAMRTDAQMNGRIPVVRVMVTNMATLRTTAMKTGSDTDVYLPRVQWLPDSRRVAIEKLNREQTRVEVLVATISNGSSRCVAKEEDPYWINIHDDLKFLKDGSHFIWSSERSGYRHLYVFTMDGSVGPMPLTSGRWEVSQLLKVDEPNNRIYFASTQASPAERQIYSVQLDGRRLTQLTDAAGTHVASFSPDGKRFIDDYSRTTSEPCASIVQVQSLKKLTLNCQSPWRSAENSFRPVEFLHVETQDGASLPAMMIKPADFDPHHHYPVIIYANSGPGQQSVVNRWNGWISLWHQFMANNGYVIFAIDTRGSAGYGHIFEEPIHFRLGAQETSDLRDAGAYLRKLAYVDTTRMAIWGIHYGGFLSLHAIFKDVEFQKAAAIQPIINLEEESVPFSERYLGVFSGHQNEFDQSSPMDSANRMHGKLLLASDLETAATLQQGLSAAGKQVEVISLPSRTIEDHNKFALAILLHRLTRFIVD